MNRRRKYPKVTGSWTYGHIIVPEKLIYIGSSDEPKCSDRWNPSSYKDCSLYPYIKKYGWNNIKHIVFKDGLTPKQAKQLEDLLITQAKIDGWCINKKGSGWYKKDNPKQYYKDHIEHIQQYHYQYYKDHQKEQVEYSRKYYKDHREDEKNKSKQRYDVLMSTTEGKIFYRVKTFNQRHKDRKIETPLEAKNKYLEYGYIPSYIKNDDLV